MKNKLMFGGILGLFAEALYMVSILNYYPYNFIVALLPLSALEGGFVTYLLYRFKLLGSLQLNTIFTMLYIILRIPTRVLAVFLATGMVLAVADQLLSGFCVDGLQISIAYVVNLSVLLVLVSALMLLSRKCLMRKTLDGIEQGTR